jgi:hypothetical protein
MDFSLSNIYDEAKLRLQLFLRNHNENKLIILMYHGVIRTPLKVYNWCFVDELSFRSQMKYIKSYFEVIPLSRAAERLRSGKIDGPIVAITFDDGLQNNYDVAFPILRESGLPATIFLTTGLVNTNDTLWYCRLNLALSETNKSSFVWNGCSFDCSLPGSKTKAASMIVDTLKKLPHPKLLAEIRKIILDLGCDPDSPIEVDSPYRMLSQEAIKEMTASGLIEFGAHTHSHAILSLLSPEECCDEIKRSITAVHEMTGRPCVLFAYPNGRSQDYNTESIRILEASGVQSSVTAIEGYNDKTSPLMELKRTGVGANLIISKFRRKVHCFQAGESCDTNNIRT